MKSPNEILEDTFCVSSNEVRACENGGYVLDSTWLSPRLVAKLVDMAFEHGRWTPPEGYSLVSFVSNNNVIMTMNDIEGEK